VHYLKWARVRYIPYNNRALRHISALSKPGSAERDIRYFRRQVLLFLLGELFWYLFFFFTRRYN